MMFFYEYKELLSISQFTKLSAIINKYPNFFKDFNESFIVAIFLLWRGAKSILFDGCGMFLVMFAVWHLYKNYFSKGFSDIRKASLALFLLFGIYSFFELSWLKLGSSWGRFFLENINPLLYDIKKVNGWWPPLLWNNQLRSLTREPSFFGIISIFILPLLWSYLFLNKNKILVGSILLYFTVMIAATNSRTAIVITTLQILCLIISVLCFKNKRYCICVTLVFCISLCSYSLNIIDFNSKFDYLKVAFFSEHKTTANGNLDSNKTVLYNATSYINNNVTSVVKINSRSNRARFANLVANFNVILKHPIMGVGTNLQDAYIDSNLPSNSLSINEVRIWKQCFRIEGPFKDTYPHLNKFADVAIQNGVIGLLLYLFPLITILYIAIKNYKFVIKDKRCIFILISILGLLCVHFSNANPALLLPNGILWGLLFCKFNKIMFSTEKSGSTKN